MINKINGYIINQRQNTNLNNQKISFGRLPLSSVSSNMPNEAYINALVQFVETASANARKIGKVIEFSKKDAISYSFHLPGGRLEYTPARTGLMSFVNFVADGTTPSTIGSGYFMERTESRDTTKGYGRLRKLLSDIVIENQRKRTLSAGLPVRNTIKNAVTQATVRTVQSQHPVVNKPYVAATVRPQQRQVPVTKPQPKPQVASAVAKKPLSLEKMVQPQAILRDQDARRRKSMWVGGGRIPWSEYRENRNLHSTSYWQAYQGLYNSSLYADARSGRAGSRAA